MTTLGQVIARVDEIKPNAFTYEAKTVWLNECEGMIQTEIMLLGVEEVIEYSWPGDEYTELLAAPPHDKVYWTYLAAMIDFANGEYNRYQNTVQLFNAHYGEYMRWYANRYRPADGAAETKGYYLSAYGIAVKHGFAGTEEEWLESLKGEPGSGGGFAYEIGHGLKVEDNKLVVDSVDNFDRDNTLPASAALVQTTVGNIEEILKTI